MEGKLGVLSREVSSHHSRNAVAPRRGGRRAVKQGKWVLFVRSTTESDNVTEGTRHHSIGRYPQKCGECVRSFRCKLPGQALMASCCGGLFASRLGQIPSRH